MKKLHKSSQHVSLQGLKVLLQEHETFPYTNDLESLTCATFELCNMPTYHILNKTLAFHKRVKYSNKRREGLAKEIETF